MTTYGEELKPIDVSEVADLLSIAKEIRDTGEARIIKNNGEDLAILMPAKPSRRAKRAPTTADYEAFLSSAGAWKRLVDTEKLKRDIAESRRISSRPPVSL